MIRAKHNIVIFGIFKIYTKLALKYSFNKVEFIGSPPNPSKSIILVANHFSWWDGFITLFFNMKILKKSFFFMMLEEQLRKFWYFRYTGGFSVSKGSRSVFESLDYASDLLNNSNNLVLIFPQGEIRTSHVKTFSFEKGVSRVIAKKNTDTTILFLVTLQDYFSNKKPSLYCYFKEVETDNDIVQISRKYNEFYRCCLLAQSKLKR